jgi:cytochrome c peroxidase
MGLFTSPEPKRNGLQVDTDYGFETESGLEEDRGRFSVPSIRNLTVTGPYMHDGRFDTLMDVLSHYNEQIGASPLPDGPLSKDGKPIKMLLNNEEKRAIVAFLGLFTDEFFLTNEAFSNPFSDAPAYE